MSDDHSMKCIVFADVSGSSRLYKSLGDDQARATIGKIVGIMMKITQQHKGTVVKTIGDEVMAHFPTADHAMEAVFIMQREITDNLALGGLPLRIGLHFGPTLEENNDVFGEAVNDAAALVAIARGRQIITSEATVNALSPMYAEKALPFDKVSIKGGDKTEVIYLVQWEIEDQSATVLMSPATTPIKTVTTLLLEYQGQSFSLTEDNMPFTIGREAGNSLQIADGVVSRSHCAFQFQRGKYVLADRSSNGTYVKAEGRKTIYLRREETALTSSGQIGVGKDVDQNPGDNIQYSVVSM